MKFKPTAFSAYVAGIYGGVELSWFDLNANFPGVNPIVKYDIYKSVGYSAHPARRKVGSVASNIITFVDEEQVNAIGDVNTYTIVAVTGQPSIDAHSASVTVAFTSQEGGHWYTWGDEDVHPFNYPIGADSQLPFDQLP